MDRLDHAEAEPIRETRIAVFMVVAVAFVVLRLSRSAIIESATKCIHRLIGCSRPLMIDVKDTRQSKSDVIDLRSHNGLRE